MHAVAAAAVRGGDPGSLEEVGDGAPTKGDTKKPKRRRPEDSGISRDGTGWA